MFVIPFGMVQRSPSANPPSDVYDRLLGLDFVPTSLNGIDFTDNIAYELSTRFTMNSVGTVTGVWLYSNNNSGIRVRLWEGSTEIRNVLSPPLTAGWNLIQIPEYSTSLGSTLTVSFSNGADFFYPLNPGFFDEARVSIEGSYTATGGFFNTNPNQYPTDAFNNSFYAIYPEVKL